MNIATLRQRSSLQVYHIVKASEGGPGGPQTVAKLRAIGIKGTLMPSHYVGHVGISVTGSQRVHARVLQTLFP